MARVSRWEIAAFAFIAIVPLFPYLEVLSHGVPRYSSIADFAIIEQHTRQVFAGKTLLGLKSRYAWHHPGPIFFYFVAPFTAAFGRASTGLYLGSWILTAVGFGSFCGMTRKATTRVHASAVLLVVIAWLAAFGDVATNPWGRLISVAPLLVALGFASLVACGVRTAIYPLTFFSCMAAETHVSTVTTAAVLALGAIAVMLARARWRGTFARDAKHVALAGVLFLVLVLPMLIEQARPVADRGNIRKLIDFFVLHHEPLRSLGIASKQWAMATAWLPDRLLERQVAHETGIPMMMRWEPVPHTLSRTARTLTAVHLATAVTAFVVAIRRRDRVSLAFLVCGVIGEAIALAALRSIIGEAQYSMIFWTTAPCAITWMGVFGAFGAWLADLDVVVSRRWQMRAAIAAVLLLAVTRTTLDQRAWTMRQPYAPATMPWISKDLQAFVTQIETSLTNDADVPVIHLGPAWPMAAAVALELEKDGFDVRYAEPDMTVFAGARGANDVTNARHLWFRMPSAQIANASCVDKIAAQSSWEAFAAKSDVSTCPL